MRPHILTYPDTQGAMYAKARYHYLLQIIFGETIGIDHCRSMAQFAPTDEARAQLLKQQTEEDTHLELLTTYVGMHPRPQSSISSSLKKLHALMVEAILQRDYIACIFIQNFIVEGLNISLLKELQHHTDVALSELSAKILHDEVSHAEFGVTELKRILREDKSLTLRRKLIWLQRKTLFYATGLAVTLAKEAKYLGIPMHEFSERTVDEHVKRISEIELQLPIVDTLLFRLAKFILKIV